MLRSFANRPLTYFFVALNAVLILISMWELLPEQNGLAHDSGIYAHIARGFPYYLYSSKVDSYYIQRIVPSSLSGMVAWLLRIERTDRYLIYSFKALDVISINLAAYFMYRVLEAFTTRINALLVALVLCFANFFVLKYTLYIPVLTDAPAFAIGAGLLYAYRYSRSKLLILLAVLGAFTHPLLLISGLALYAYPLRKPVAIKPYEFRIGFVLPFVLPVLYFSICTAIYLFHYNLIANRETAQTTHVNMQLYFLSLACACIYLYVIGAMAVHAKLPERLIREFSIRRASLVAVVFVAVKVLQYIRSEHTTSLTLKRYGMNIVMTSITYPIIFLVAHITFFGPAVILIILFFKRYRNALHDMGTGYIAVLTSILLLAICSESRQLTYGWPFVLIPLVVILKRSTLTSGVLFALAAACLLLSKIWFPLNYGTAAEMDQAKSLNDRFFLNMGPWMRSDAYIVQLGVFVLIGGILYWLIKRSLKDQMG